MTLTVTTDRTKIEAALINWIKAATGYSDDKIILLNQEVTRPAKPYVGMYIVNRGIKTGQDDVIQEYNPTSGRVERTVAGPRQMSVQLETYTDPAADAATLEADSLLENILLALETEAVRDIFRTAKIGFLRQETGINRLDEQLGERWERRAQADLTFTYSGEIFDDGSGSSGDWIETVDYDLNAAE